MSLFAFFLILASVFLHAGWNFISKKTESSSAFFMLAALAAALFCSCFLPFISLSPGVLPGRFWIFFAVSILFESLYFFSLARGYRCGDISMVYPMGRALPVLLIAALTLIFGIGAKPSGTALCGMVTVFAGCLLMPLKSFREFSFQAYRSRVIFFILLIAAGTTGYTIADSRIMAILRQNCADSELMISLWFSCYMELGIALVLALFVLPFRQGRAELRRLAGKPMPYLAGIFSVAAYVLVLIAMNYVTNVSFLQAFRQMSLPVGMLLGVFLLKEACSRPRIVGMVLIVLGLILTVV